MKKALSFKNKLILYLFLVLMILSAVLVLFFLYYNQLEQRQRHSIEREIKMVTELKSFEIAQWYRQRRADAEVFSRSNNMIRSVQVLIESNASDESKKWHYQSLQKRCQSVCELNHYKDVIVIDTQNRIVCSITDDTCGVISNIERSKQESNDLREGIFIDFHEGCQMNEVRLDVISPFCNSDGVVSYLVLRVNPNDYLFPLLDKWSQDENNMETIMAREEGDSMLIFSSQNGLKLERFATSQVGKIAFSNRRHDGIVREGVDYKNDAVLFYVVPVDGTKWMLGAKIKRDQVYGPVNQMAITGAIILFLILVTLIAFGVIIWSVDRRKTLEALLGQEAKLREVMDKMLEGCQIIGFDWRYKYLNDAAVRDARKSREELLGKTMMACYPGINQTALWQNLEKCMSQRITMRVENEFIYSDGSIGWFSLSVQPIPEGIFLLSLDITEQKLAEEKLKASERNLKLFVDNAPASIAMFDKEMRYMEVSQRYIVDYHVDVVDLIGMSHYDVFPDLPNHWKIIHQRCLAGETIRSEEDTFPREDGTIDWLRWEIHPWYNAIGEIGGVLLFSEVITERKRNEERLKDINRKFKKAQQIAQMGSWEYDFLTDRYQFSEEGCRILGLETGIEVTSEKISEIFPANEFEKFENAKQRFIDEDGVLKVDLHLFIDRSVDRYAHIEAELIQNGNGMPAKLLGVIQDVTAARLSEKVIIESEFKLRRFYESGLTGVVYWSINGLITDSNDKFLEMTGYTRHELELHQVNWHEMTPPEYKHQDQLMLEELSTYGRNSQAWEKQYIRKDGTLITVLVACATLDFLDSLNGIAFILDISDRKKAELEIIRLNEDLERRVEARTSQLKLLNDDLESFAYTVSHDLRAPLRGISGFAQFLIDDYGVVLDDDGRRLCQIILDNTQKMKDLISDLLDFSRVRAKEIICGNVNMRDVIQSAINDCCVQAEGVDIQFDVKDIHDANADYAMMKQVWINLISNSIKYSSTRDKISIQISSEDCGDVIKYTITDNGIGIDMNYAYKLFGVFQRLHNNPQYEGTGVGLAIVKRIIEKHNGNIWVESKLNEGATFCFVLPNTIESINS